MKTKSKKIVCVALAVLIILAFSTVISGCGEKENEMPAGELLGLKTAYDRGLLTEDDLQEIAHYHNDSIAYPESIPDDIAGLIKKTYLYRLCNENCAEDATVDDIDIKKYYGEYSGAYVVIINDNYSSAPADVPYRTEEIAGVEFEYVGYDIIEVWYGNDHQRERGAGKILPEGSHEKKHIVKN